MIKLITLLITICTFNIFAQSNDHLMVKPRHLHFQSDFERSQIVHVTNNSSGAINIDSIIYDDSIYLLRLSRNRSFPIELESGSSFDMEILQYNYFNLHSNDSVSSITIYNSSYESEIVLRTHHHQEFQEYHNGKIEGIVRGNSVGIEGATVYFFYNQNLLIDSAKTDNNGYYEKYLPEGNYFVAAVTNGFYMSFAYGKDSPLGADLLNVDRMTPISADFELEEEVTSGIDISGDVTDIQYDVLGKAIVIVRKGRHTPTRSLDKMAADSVEYYTTITDVNGHYNINNLKSDGDYYVQAFAPFNIPGYYNHEHSPSAFWQNADSIRASTSIENINITLVRDSSYGAGVVEGTIISSESNAYLGDAIVYARSKKNEKYYSYALTSSDGKFSIPVLPYGDYDLVTNTYGVDDIISDTFSISTIQDSVKGLRLNLNLTSLENENVKYNFQLKQNYPNPFNPKTTIKYSMREGAHVNIKVFNSIGEEIKTLVNRIHSAGRYEIEFYAANLPTGVYFYQIKAGQFVETKKMVLIK